MIKTATTARLRAEYPDRSFSSTLARGGVRAFIVAVASAFLLIAASPSSADDVGGEPVVIPSSPDASAEPKRAATYRANDEDDWKFLVSINPWFIFLNGTISIADVSVPVDVGFDNIWTQLHMAVMADVEVQKGNFGLFTDISWARLWARNEGPLITTKVDLDWALFDFALYWEALSLKLGSRAMPPRLRLQPYSAGDTCSLDRRLTSEPTFPISAEYSPRRPTQRHPYWGCAVSSTSTSTGACHSRGMAEAGEWTEWT